jgi:hypothetical protein
MHILTNPRKGRLSVISTLERPVEDFKINLGEVYVSLKAKSKASVYKRLRTFTEGRDYVFCDMRKTRKTDRFEFIFITEQCYHQLKLPSEPLRDNRTLCTEESVGKRFKTNRISEIGIAKTLSKELDGQREVAVPGGYIDILTADELIEVKAVKAWKTGIGQLMVYSAYYPNHAKRLHLFGHCNKEVINLIKEHCERLNIRLTYEPNLNN